jgi:hypothetical protein
VSIQEIPHPEPLFHHLFDPLRGYLFTASLEWGNEHSWTQLPWHYPDEAESAAGWVTDAAQLGLETYYSAHLFKTPRNRQRGNALEHVMALWLDLDDGEYPDDGPQPTLRVRTSTGKWHLYFRLTEPIGAEHAQDLNRRLCAFAGGDPTGVPLSSVLRPPGTARYKGARPELVVGWYTGVPAWEAAVIEQALPVLEEPGVDGHRPPYTGAPVNLAPYLEVVQVLGPASDGTAEKYRIVCPWASEHSHGDKTGTYLMRFPSGAVHFECKHQHCHRRKWREFKTRVLRMRRNNTRVGNGPHTTETEVIE